MIRGSFLARRVNSARLLAAAASIGRQPDPAAELRAAEAS